MNKPIRPDRAREKRQVNSLSVLWPYLARQKLLLTAACIALFLAAITTLAVPVGLRWMIDRGFSADNSQVVGSYFRLLLLLALFLALASALRYYFVILIGERVVADLRRDVFAHVTSLSAAFFDREQSGEIVSRLTADTTQIKSAVGATASLALRNSLLAAGSILMMVVTSPGLSAFVLIAIPFIILPLIAFGRRVRRRSRQAQDRLAEASAYASEAIGAVRTLQAFTREKSVVDRYRGDVENAYNAARAAIGARAILTAISIFMVFSSIILVLWYGAIGVLDGTISPGTLSQFVLYALFAGGAVASLSEVFGEFAQAAGAAERLAELLAVSPAIAAPEDPAGLPSRLSGRIGFHDVSFTYPSRPDLPTLSHVDFRIAPGETVAIVGPSGGGKTTLFSLLLRFYDPVGGFISLDGIPLQAADPRTIRSQIAWVPQDVMIFAASAADNIGFGRPGADRSAIEAAARAALAEEFIEALPQGYDTPLGERGVTLSGGQRQRIAIARAILKDAPLLLLDEATSALDSHSETLVQTALENLARTRTTLVIAHRLATVQSADRILVMQAGIVAEKGTHAQLMAEGGLYAHLAELQFKGATRPAPIAR